MVLYERFRQTFVDVAFLNPVSQVHKGNGSDRAPQDSRLRSQRGGVEFINFPFGSFGSEQLLESGLGSKRANTDRAVDPELKNREISFLTRILGRTWYDPNMHFSK